jgi:hypothetical protein
MVQFHIGLAAYAAWLMMMYRPQTAEIGAKRAELMGVYLGKVNEAIQTFGNTISAPWRFRVDDVRAR